MNAIVLTAANLAEVDVTEHVARIRAIDDQIGEVDTAQVSSVARLNALAEEIRHSIDGPDGDAAARAVMAGESVLTATHGAERLNDEREALLAALRSLRQKRILMLEDRKAAINALCATIGVAFDPIVDDLEKEVEKLAARLVQLMRGVVGPLLQLTRLQRLDHLLRQLHPIVNEIFDARLAAGGHETPAEIAELIAVAQRLREVPPAPTVDERNLLLRAPSLIAGPVRSTTLA